MKVEQIMRHHVLACRPTDSLEQAARVMWEEDCGSVPIVRDGDEGARVVAMLTDRDVAMAAYTQGRPLGQICIQSAMSKAVHSCRPTDPVAIAFKIMSERQLHRLPVVDGDGVLVGMLSLADIVRESSRERTHGPAEITDRHIANVLVGISEPRQPMRALTAAA